MENNSAILEINKCLNFTSTNDHADYCVLTLDIIPGYSTFYENFILKNLPCVVRNVSLHWECNKKWVTGDKINCDYFINTYGDLDAPVADCNDIAFNAQSKTILKVNEYFNYLQSNNKDKLLYLKDWHLRKLRPNDTFYETPIIFASDWLNEYAQDHQEDDFMFVYIGPADSWTPLHADVYNSFSWSVNVIGRKKWTFIPPGEEDKLKDPLGNLRLLFNHNNSEKVKYFEIIQEQGDAIFVPSGWHHQVINLLDTISINHNWINACNIEEVWRALENCLLNVEHEIEEFRDSTEFVDQCQLILKSTFGMNFENYINFIYHIANKRHRQFQGDNLTGFDQYLLGKNQIIFDLKKLNSVINLFHNHPLIIKDHIQINYRYDYLTIKQSISDVLTKVSVD